MLPELFRHDGKIEPLLTGVGQATTFTGFCAEHDSKLSRALETAPFTASTEQLLLLTFRAVARELFAKRGMLQMVPLGKQLDRGKTAAAQAIIQSYFSGLGTGAELGLSDLERHKRALDTALGSVESSPIHGYVIEIDTVPSFLCAGALFPEVDFQGRQLQKFGDVQAELDLVAFSILPTETGGAFVFSWLGEQPACDALMGSLEQLSADQIPSALTRFTFEFFENVAFSPLWWEGLPADARRRLNQRFLAGANPVRERDTDCLLFDGLQPVSWTVTRRFRAGAR